MQSPVIAGPSALPMFDFDLGLPKDLKDIGCDVVKLVADALSIESIAHASRESLRNAGSVAQDSILGAFGSYCTLNAFIKCTSSGFFSPDGLSGLANGLNATALADRAVQTGTGAGTGFGNYQAMTGRLVTAATLISRAYQGDVPGVMLSGAKLVVSAGVTGNSVAQLVIAADLAYSNAAWLPGLT